MKLHLNIKCSWIRLFFLSTVIFFTISAFQAVLATELFKQTLIKDATWNGTIILNGDVYVPSGVTLTISPGTTIKFRKIDKNSEQNLFSTTTPYYHLAELIIRGKLLARGTADKQIVFTSAESIPSPADWGAVNFLGSQESEMEYVKISYAYNGIHAHGSTVKVSNSEFSHNGVGISFKKETKDVAAPWFAETSNLMISYSKFFKNKGGIAFRSSQASIHHNDIRDNSFFAIWPKEDCEALVTYNEITDNKKGIYLYQARGVQLEQNNIYGNSSYDIAVGEAQDYPFNAANNWFGTTDMEKIREMIFDKHSDPDLVEIVIEPFLREAVDIGAGQ